MGKERKNERKKDKEDEEESSLRKQSEKATVAQRKGLQSCS
jgi:hypothetical protein